MPIEKEQLKIDHLIRVARALGWQPITQDRAGADLRVTLTRPKEEPELPTTTRSRIETR